MTLVGEHKLHSTIGQAIASLAGKMVRVREGDNYHARTCLGYTQDCWGNVRAVVSTEVYGRVRAIDAHLVLELQDWAE